MTPCLAYLLAYYLTHIFTYYLAHTTWYKSNKLFDKFAPGIWCGICPAYILANCLAYWQALYLAYPPAFDLFCRHGVRCATSCLRKRSGTVTQTSSWPTKLRREVYIHIKKQHRLKILEGKATFEDFEGPSTILGSLFISFSSIYIEILRFLQVCRLTVVFHGRLRLGEGSDQAILNAETQGPWNDQRSAGTVLLMESLEMACVL